MAQCSAFDPNGPYVSGVVGFVDCHMVALGEEGYRALGPTTAFGFVLTGLLTIYVALIGYRMILGYGFAMRDGVTIALRVGIVVALATQWSAYRPLLFDLAVKGPEDIMMRILPSGGLGGDDMVGLTMRVQRVNDVLDVIAQMPIAIAGELAPQGEGSPDAQNRATATPSSRPVILTVRQQATIGLGNMLLLLSTLAGIVVVHVVVGLLLALGPLFLAFLLFDATQGFLAGWVRVLAGAVMGGIAVPLVVSLFLAVLEPQVIALVGRIDGGVPVGALSTQIFATVGLFVLVMIFALVSAIRTAAAFRLPYVMRFSSSEASGQRGASTQLPVPYRGETLNADVGNDLSRAQGVADAVTTLERREKRMHGENADTSRRAQIRPGGTRDFVMVDPPLGQAGRRAAPRRSVGGKRRDRTT